MRERVEVVEWNKKAPSLPQLSCELSVSGKENPDREEKKKATTAEIISNQFSCISTFPCTRLKIVVMTYLRVITNTIELLLQYLNLLY